jgi:hypothetical protein
VATPFLSNLHRGKKAAHNFKAPSVITKLPKVNNHPIAQYGHPAWPRHWQCRVFIGTIVTRKFRKNRPIMSASPVAAHFYL